MSTNDLLIDRSSEEHPLNQELREDTIKDKTQAGYVHSIETGAGADGPGMRCAIFLTGCHFRCLYCHNPDTWKLKDGTLMTIEQVMNEILPYKGFLKIAGGVTISGGEPLVQHEFVGEIFRRCKKEGLHTALDTQGYLGDHVSDEWLECVDLVMLDIKSIDPEVHVRLTAQKLENTLHFAERMKRLNKPMWIRYVVLPGYTDNLEDAEKLADYVKELGSVVERVEILPFHKLGEHKWHELGMKYELDDTQPPSHEVMEAIQAKFKERGIYVV